MSRFQRDGLLCVACCLFVPAQALVRECHFPAAYAHKLGKELELEGHDGCVNRLAWSEDGTLLASGSDDRHVGMHYLQARSACAYQE